jgi:hypothetical protein
MEVHVRKEEAFGARLDVVSFESVAVPNDVDAVVVEVKVIGAPIDVRVDFGEPGFAEDEVVFVERVENRVERVGVVAAIKGDGDRV